MTIRTRFAPSPTGYLHIGGVRTALYSYLYAKHTGGKFILRIEDTDRERSTPDSIDAIIAGMKWLGLESDEALYYQSKRFDRYHEVAEELLMKGFAYRCYCSKKRLETLREAQLARKEKPRYDGHCRELTQAPSDKPFVVRFKNPHSGEVCFIDAVRGELKFNNAELDDLVLLRTDGVPTYNFSVVIDDCDMGITHVIRGDDHINNTPRQINLLHALGSTPPHYAHVPMILGPDGKRLSKRHGAVSVLHYREAGFLPQALLNYLVRLGWSHGDQEIFTLDEMIEYFNLQHINNSAASFSLEKLQWVNQQHLKTLDVALISKEFAWHLKQLNISYQEGADLAAIIEAQRERCMTVKEMAEKSRYFFEDFTEFESKAQKHLKPAIVPALTQALEQFKALTEWQAQSLHDVIIQLAEKLQLKLGKLAQPIRVAVTGGTVSPPIDITLQILGKEKTIKRLEAAIEFAQQKTEA